jgi:uncharacterized protein
MLAVVSDSSPLVYLSKLQQFHLLRLIYDAVLVPPAVWQEVAVVGARFAEGVNLRAAVNEGWIRVEIPSQTEEQTVQFPINLGRGEAEAIVLACEKNAVFLTDDALGRSVAQSLGLQVSGTLGVLIRAKQQNHLSAVKPLIDRLKRETNFRLSEARYVEALRMAGESDSYQ